MRRRRKSGADRPPTVRRSRNSLATAPDKSYRPAARKARKARRSRRRSRRAQWRAIMQKIEIVDLRGRRSAGNGGGSLAKTRLARVGRRNQSHVARQQTRDRAVINIGRRGRGARAARRGARLRQVGEAERTRRGLQRRRGARRRNVRRRHDGGNGRRRNVRRAEWRARRRERRRRGDDGRRGRVGKIGRRDRKSERNRRRREVRRRRLKEGVGQTRDHLRIERRRRVMGHILRGRAIDGRIRERGSDPRGGHADAFLQMVDRRREAAGSRTVFKSCLQVLSSSLGFRRICRRSRGICRHRHPPARQARHGSAPPPSSRARSDKRRSPCG